MNPEVFRFITIRPPQKAAATRYGAVAFVISDGPDSLVSRIRAYREPSHHGTLLETVRAYIQSEDFLVSESGLDPRLVEFHAALIAIADEQFDAAAKSSFQASFGTDPASFASDNSVAGLRERISNRANSGYGDWATRFGTADQHRGRENWLG